MYYYFR